MAEWYQDPGVLDPMTGTYVAYPTYTNEGDSMFSGWSSTLQDVLKLGATTAAQGWLLQKNMKGAAYIEGQRIAQQQQQAKNLTGGIPLLLLLGGAALVFMLAKD